MDRSARLADIAANAEYRAVLAAAALSWFGDMLAKAALTYLVFTQTDSVAWSAATFAIGFFPWVAGGPLLSAYAERHPFRRTMIGCDLLRMAAIGLVALPGLPVATGPGRSASCRAACSSSRAPPWPRPAWWDRACRCPAWSAAGAWPESGSWPRSASAGPLRPPSARIPAAHRRPGPVIRPGRDASRLPIRDGFRP